MARNFKAGSARHILAEKFQNDMEKKAEDLKAANEPNVTELARVFCRRLGRPRAVDLEVTGFTDLQDLLLRGLIVREPGRWSIGYMPGELVIRQMWQIYPALCSVLNLRRVNNAMEDAK